MPIQRFVLNGSPVEVDAPDDVRLLWVLRDLLGVTGPKYGCGLSVCQACTSHLNGVAVNLCSIPVGDVGPDDEVLTIEGLAASVGRDLHPAQEIWIDLDVAQCGFCQPGQIMTAVDLVHRAEAEGRDITDADLDDLRNVCRCGTYPRVRAAIRALQAAVRAEAEVRAAPATPTETLPATGGGNVLGPAVGAIGTGVAIRAGMRRLWRDVPAGPGEPTVPGDRLTTDPTAPDA